MSSAIGKERPFVVDTRGKGGNGAQNAGYGIEIASMVKPRHRLISVYHGTNLSERSPSLPDVRQSSQIMISSFRDTVSGSRRCDEVGGNDENIDDILQ